MALYLLCPIILCIMGNINEAFSSPNENQTVNSKQGYAIEIENFMVFTKIKYRFGRTKVFCEMRNPHPNEAQESEFSLILPKDAFISNFTMEINGQQYKSLIKDKGKATETYKDASRSGTTAAIINEENYNFKISINLAANLTVLFFLEYQEEIEKITHGLSGYYQYALNLIPQMLTIKHFCVEVDISEYKEFKITSVNLCNAERTCIDLELLKEAQIVQKPNNGTIIIWEPTSRKGKMKELLETKTIGMFKLNYEFIDNEIINDVLIDGSNGYFIHRFGLVNLPTIPVHAIFVLDTSDSMADSSLGKNMKEAMKNILADMKEHDFFSIITFSSDIKLCRLPPLDQKYGKLGLYPTQFYFINMALKYMDDIQFEGSTNINEALLTALEIAENASSLAYGNGTALGLSPVIFFLTDGKSSSGEISPNKILENVRKANKMSVPIFSVAFGKYADKFLLQTLSAQNNGISRVLYESANVKLQLEDFYKFAASPTLKDLKFHYTNPYLDISNITFDSESGIWLSTNSEITVIGNVNIDLKSPTMDWSHLTHSHGVKLSSIPTFYTSGLDGKSKLDRFQARICPCGICPSIKQNVSNISPDITKLSQLRCANIMEEKSFRQKYWVYKTIHKLIRKVVQTGNETVKQHVIQMSKEHHLLTPYTSLLIKTPFNSKTATDQVRLNSKNVSDLAGSTTEKNYLPSISPKLAFYSAIRRPIVKFSHQQIQPSKSTSLSLYFQSLKKSHENFLSNLANESENDKISHKLNLNDIQWINIESYSMKLKYLKSEEFLILKDELPKSNNTTNQNQKCWRDQTGNRTEGICMHLYDCIEKQYLSDVNLFEKDYFCPITLNSTKYAGTCCLKK